SPFSRFLSLNHPAPPVTPSLPYTTLFRSTLGREGLFRVVLIHHPPVSRLPQHFKRLIDAAPLRRVIAAHGAELVLHGHAHVHLRSEEHTSELQSLTNLVCRLLLENKK